MTFYKIVLSSKIRMEFDLRYVRGHSNCWVFFVKQHRRDVARNQPTIVIFRYII